VFVSAASLWRFNGIFISKKTCVLQTCTQTTPKGHSLADEPGILFFKWYMWLHNNHNYFKIEKYCDIKIKRWRTIIEINLRCRGDMKLIIELVINFFCSRSRGY
jgi:hypothetical protein